MKLIEHPELELEDRLESLLLDKLDSELPELEGSGRPLESVELPWVVFELPRVDWEAAELDEIISVVVKLR